MKSILVVPLFFHVVFCIHFITPGRIISKYEIQFNYTSKVTAPLKLYESTCTCLHLQLIAFLLLLRSDRTITVIVLAQLLC
jgi:hypothetical protein